MTTAEAVTSQLPQSKPQGVSGAGDRPASMAAPQSDPTPSSSQARSAEAAGTPSSSQSRLPPGPILAPGFEWLEKSLREMLNVGLGYDRLTYVDNVDPDHLLTHMAIKSFEVTFLLLCLYKQPKGRLLRFLTFLFMQHFALGIRLTKLQHLSFGGPISHQAKTLSDLRNQVRVLTEERDRLKELGLTAEDKQKMEAQLAEVKLENSKLATDLSGYRRRAAT